MADDKRRFREQTILALYECAYWMLDNRERLAEQFVNNDMGCKSWSIAFSFDSERCPRVVVDTDCKHVAVVDGAYD